VEEVDEVLDLERVTDRLARALNHMAPFGPANMRPVFASIGVVDSGRCRIVGEDHLKLALHPPGRPERAIDAIAFRQGRHLDMVKSGEPFSVLYTIEENEWQGRKSLQLNIKDIKAGVADVIEEPLVVHAAGNA
jgi:single-stranded-DNA-specific exonuclease